MLDLKKYVKNNRGIIRLNCLDLDGILDLMTGERSFKEKVKGISNKSNFIFFIEARSSRVRLFQSS